MTLNWCACSFGYYVCSFYLKYFKGSLYVNATVFTAASVLSSVLYGIKQKYMSTPRIFQLCFGLCTIGACGFLLTEDYPNLIPVWILWMTYCLNTSFSMVYYGTYEFFPSQY